MLPAHAQNLDLSLTYTDIHGNSMPYRMFVPQAHMSPGEKVPVVLFLHGAGEKGSNNTSQVASHVNGLISTTQGSAFTGILIAPQLPDQGANRWFDTTINNGGGTPATAFDMVLGMVDDAIATRGGDAGRQYLTGLSLGGEGSWVLAQEQPDRFAALAPMSGRTSLFTWEPDTLADIPTWAFHGDSDAVVPYQDSVDLIDAIEGAGGSPRFTTIDGGHTIWAPIYDGGVYADDGGGAATDLYTWMYSYSIPEPATLALLTLGGLAAAVGLRRHCASENFSQQTLAGIAPGSW
jgi:predicted peptidase